MNGNQFIEKGRMRLTNIIETDHMVVSVAGDEVYQLTDKTSGKVSLVGFESKIAAGRFFSANDGFFASKIN